MRALLFDLDNTLIDRDGAYAAYVRDLLERIREAQSVAGVTPALNQANSETLFRQIIDHDRGGRCDRLEHCRWLASLLTNVFEQPISPPARGDELWREQQRHLCRFLEPDLRVHDMLRQLRNRFNLALVTNGSSVMQRAKLRASGLTDFFESIVISGELRLAKPNAGVFQSALRALRIPPTRAIMVGDRLEHDILPALQLGMTAVWVRNGQSPAVSHGGLVIENINQLQAILPAALAALASGFSS